MGLVVVLVSAGALGLVRARGLATGLPCEARSWMGCAIDGPIYAVVTAGLGIALIAIVSAVVALVDRRAEDRSTTWPWMVATVVWAALFVFLLAGASGT
jgi:hypothetical protein